MSVDPLDKETFADGPLSVSRHRYGNDVLVLSLGGELDRSNVETAHRAIADINGEGEEEILVVDLSALQFIDSSGVALLYSLADTGGESLRIVPSEAPAVARVLKLTGIEEAVKFAHERPLRAA